MRPSRRPAAGRLRIALLLAVAVVPTSLGAGFLNPFPAGADTINTVGSSQSSSRSNITLDRPSGTSAGHVMVASLVSNSDSPSFTAPAGWTLVRSASIPGALLQAAYVKVAGADEPGSYTWSVGKSRNLAGGITAYSGVSTASPVDAHGASVQSTATTSVTAPSVTTTETGGRLLHLAAISAGGTVSPPAGMTERWEMASTSKPNRQDVLAALADVALGTAGATGTRTAITSIAAPNIGIALALRPAGAASPPDSTPPDTTITSGPSGTVGSSTATFSFSSTEANSTFVCKLDAGPFEPCSSPRTYSGLTNGSHTFSVAATDPAGNQDPDPASRTWTVGVSGDTVLAGAGDISTCSNNNDEATAQLLDAVVASHPNAKVFTTGDNVYESGTATEFANCYNPTWGRHKARTSPSVGNHEYGTAGASGYFNYFGAAAGESGKGYYDYTLGGWHVIALNSQCSAVGGCFAGSAQEQWLRSRLAAVSAECTVAYWHHPRFSSGANHGTNPTYQPLWQALYDAGADLVLNGHDHIYERFGPQTPAGQADATYGIRQITIGTGGRSLYGTIAPIANSQFVYNSNYGILKLTLRGGSYDWQMIRVGGVTVDAGTSNCHGAPPAPPPPPPPPPGEGPIAVVGSSSSESSSSRTSMTISRPSGTQAGHVMLASVVVNDDDVISAPAGWTVVRQDTISNTLRQAIYYRVAGSSEPSAYTWTLPDWRRIAGGITAYSGVNTTTPIDAHAAFVQTTATTAVTAPSVTTTVADARLLHFAAVNAEGTIAPPGGMAERWEAASPNSSNTRDAIAALADAVQTAAGSTGSRTATASSPGRNIGTAVALRPA